MSQITEKDLKHITDLLTELKSDVSDVKKDISEILSVAN